MKRILLFIPSVIFLLVALLFYRGLFVEHDDSLPSALLNDQFPKFELPSLLSEQVVTEGDLLGKTRLINVWASWCVACRVEHAELMKISRENVPLIGLNYKDDMTVAQDWLSKMKDPYQEIIFDRQGKLGFDLGVYGAPETFLIDGRGVIRFRHVGVLTEDIWQNQIKPLYEKYSKKDHATHS